MGGFLLEELMPPTFETYSDVSSKAMISAVGENFSVLDSDDEVILELRGIFDTVFIETAEGDVPVRVRQTNVFFRNVDTGGTLSRRNHRIRRESNGQIFNILDIARDDVSTTNYFLEGDDDAVS